MHNESLATQGMSPNITRLATPISMFSDDFQRDESPNATQQNLTNNSGHLA